MTKECSTAAQAKQTREMARKKLNELHSIYQLQLSIQVTKPYCLKMIYYDIDGTFPLWSMDHNRLHGLRSSY